MGNQVKHIAAEAMENLGVIFEAQSPALLRQQLLHWSTMQHSYVAPKRKQKAELREIYRTFKTLVKTALQLDTLPPAQQTQLIGVPQGVIRTSAPISKHASDFYADWYSAEEHLSAHEMLDPFLYFNQFFQQLTGQQWLELLHKWKTIALKRQDFPHYTMVPKHRAAIQKLVEACYLLYQINHHNVPILPSTPFLQSFNLPHNLNVEQISEPVFFLYLLLANKPLATFKTELHQWIYYAQQKEQHPDAYALVKLQEAFSMLIDFAFLFANMEYISIAWLDHKNWSVPDPHLPEADNCQYEYLTEAEMAAPLSALAPRLDFELGYQHEALQQWTLAALNKEEVCTIENKQVSDMLGILEALYLFIAQVLDDRAFNQTNL